MLYELLPDRWVEFCVCIHVYLVAFYYVLKELMFEAKHQGIYERLQDEIYASRIMQNSEFRTAMVTGADGTIGSQVTLRLLRLGFTVHAICGNRDKAKQLFKHLLKKTAEINRLKIYALDLEDPDAVKDFCIGFKRQFSEIHVMILCAGIMLAPEVYIDNVESHQCVNVVSQVTMLELLKEHLHVECRIAMLSSATAHAAFRVNDALHNYIGPYQAYASSKLVLTDYVYVEATKRNHTIVCLHPGVVPGHLYRNLNILSRLVTYLILPHVLRKARFSSLLVLHTALRNDVVSGGYYEDTKLVTIRGSQQTRQRNYDSTREKMLQWIEDNDNRTKEKSL